MQSLRVYALLSTTTLTLLNRLVTIVIHVTTIMCVRFVLRNAMSKFLSVFRFVSFRLYGMLNHVVLFCIVWSKFVWCP